MGLRKRSELKQLLRYRAPAGVHPVRLADQCGVGEVAVDTIDRERCLDFHTRCYTLTTHSDFLLRKGADIIEAPEGRCFNCGDRLGHANDCGEPTGYRGLTVCFGIV